MQSPSPNPRPASPEDAEPPFQALVGVTASGKTAVALEVCERAGAELVSMDSMLVYRGLDVGTAKPTNVERERVPHHVIDVVGPEQRYTVQAWLSDARAAERAIRARGKRVLFVGGTALYLKALCQGLFEGPPTDLGLRGRIEARVEHEGLAALHAELARIDPESAERIHANDRKRVVRALEVFEQTGRRLSAWQREWSPGAPGRGRRIVGLEVDVGTLDERIRARTQAMLDAGWPDEVRRLSGPGASRLGPTAGQALGYAEVGELVRGACTLEACAERIALRTRQFARRQRTWFKSFAEIEWIPAPAGPSDVSRAADAVLAALGWA